MDACGRSSFTTATFTIVDTVPPTITPAVSVSVECDGAGNLGDLNAWLANNGGAGANDICSSVTWSNSFAGLSDGCGGTGSATVTFTARDACGNFSTTSATFTIVDTTEPALTTQAVSVTVECDGNGNVTDLEAWLNSNGGAGAQDDCSSVTWSNDFTALSDGCGGTGSATVTFTATDDCGNATNTTATFTIIDSTSPSISPILAVTVECTSPTDPSNTGIAAAQDSCGGVTVTHSDTEAGGCGNTTTITRIWTAVDSCGNMATSEQIITVVDTTPPTLDSAPNITVGCSVDPLLPVTFSLPAAVDSCGDTSVSSVPISGANFPVGTTVVNVTATDACGNSVSSTFDVTRSALDFTGFLPPIDGADSTGGSFASPLRPFKLGSTIPVKFKAFCGGSPVVTGIHTLQAIKYSSSTSSEAPIDATPTDAATTGSQFRLTDSTWHYNLSTKGFTQGTWKLVATLSDGSTHEVWIAIKK